MSESAAMLVGAVTTPPYGVVECRRGHHHWRVVGAHSSLLDIDGIDWFHLHENAHTTLVKSNSQRDVWRIRCNGREYFAKLYHPNGWVARAKLLVRGPMALREWQVGRYAAAHDIAAVVPVATAWSGHRGVEGTSLLITESITQGMPLNEYWLTVRDDRVAAERLSDSLARLIARSHQCGFKHGDMHPGNILVRRAGELCETFFVDLHKVHIAQSVGERKAIENLALLNQWFRSHATRSLRRRFLRAYKHYLDEFSLASPFSRKRQINPGILVAKLRREAQRHADALWSKRDRRMDRNSRYFARIRPAPGWRGHVLLSAKHMSPTASASKHQFTQARWSQWLADPLSWVDPARHTLLKDSHTSTICRAVLPTEPPEEVICKRHLARNAWKLLLQRIGPSRNRRAWRTANMLRHRDLPTAQPLALVERYTLGVFHTDSILITEMIRDAVDLETFLTRDLSALQRPAQRRVKNRLISAVVQLIKMFHDRGFVHRDLKAPNLLVNWTAPYEGEPLLTFIDMDGIRHVGVPREIQMTRAVARLCASLCHSPGCTRTDQLRFLRRYLSGPGRSFREWKTHWRSLSVLVREKLADKDVRRQWKLAHYGRE